MSNLKEAKTLKLENPVVVRKVPMTSHGCDMLRAIRDRQVDVLSKQHGIVVDIPFPTSIQLMMSDYCQMHNIEVTPSQEEAS